MRTTRGEPRPALRGKRPTFALGYLLIAVSLGAACGTPSRQNQSAASDGSFPRTVKAGDMEINVPRKPERIVSLTPSNDEILCALVDEKRIAGLSKFSQDAATSYATEVALRINVFVDRNAEQIVSLRPDLVLAARYTKVDLKALLAETGTPLVVTTEFRNFADVEANLRLIGQAVGEEGRAEAVIGEMRRKLSAARSRLRAGSAGLRLLYLASGNFSAGSGTSIHEILIAARFEKRRGGSRGKRTRQACAGTNHRDQPGRDFDRLRVRTRPRLSAGARKRLAAIRHQGHQGEKNCRGSGARRVDRLAPRRRRR